MIRLRTWPVIFILVASMAMAFMASPAKAMSLAEMKGLVDGETDQRIETLNKVVAQGDENTLVFLQALADDAVKVAGDKIWIVRDNLGAGKALDPLTGQKQDLPADAQDVVSNNRFRGEIETALAALKLFSADTAMRQQAIKALLKEPDASKLKLLNKALAQEQDAALKNLLQLAKAAAQLGDADVAVALRMDGYITGESSTGIPVGVYRAGGMRSPIFLDADFLVGPEAAHLNISGVSGLATKTSAIEWLLQSIFAHFPADKGSVAAVCFNVKGPDLLYLDQPATLAPEDVAMYEKLGVPAEPFQNVRYYAPFDAALRGLATIRSNEALQQLAHEGVGRGRFFIRVADAQATADIRSASEPA